MNFLFQNGPIICRKHSQTHKATYTCVASLTASQRFFIHVDNIHITLIRFFIFVFRSKIQPTHTKLYYDDII